jgi:hypothetical protein
MSHAFLSLEQNRELPDVRSNLCRLCFINIHPTGLTLTITMSRVCFYIRVNYLYSSANRYTCNLSCFEDYQREILQNSNKGQSSHLCHFVVPKCYMTL